MFRSRAEEQLSYVRRNIQTISKNYDSNTDNHNKLISRVLDPCRISYVSVSHISHVTPTKQKIYTVCGENVRRNGVTLKRSESPSPSRVTIRYQSQNKFNEVPNIRQNAYELYYTKNNKDNRAVSPVGRFNQVSGIQSGLYQQILESPHKTSTTGEPCSIYYNKNGMSESRRNNARRNNQSESMISESRMTIGLAESKITKHNQTMADSFTQSRTVIDTDRS